MKPRRTEPLDWISIRPHDGAPGLTVRKSDSEDFVKQVIQRTIDANPEQYAPDAADVCLDQWRAWHAEREAVTT